jgi:DNA-binding MarR family transcriptional regulator
MPDKRAMNATPPPTIAVDTTLAPQCWSRYQDNFARYLLGVAGEYKRVVMARLKADPDYHVLRLSFESVVTTLAAGPLRATDIAARLGLSKQHASQLIADVQRAGLVEKRSDPDDNRARLVALTRLGERLVGDGVLAAVAVSEQFAAHVGAAAMAYTLRQTARLCDGLGLQATATPWEAPVPLGLSSAGAVGAQAMGALNTGARLKGSGVVEAGVIGEELMRLADHVQESLMMLCQVRGFRDLKRNDGQVLIHMRLDGARLQDLARYNDMSTQGVGRIVRDLEQRGYVQRRTATDDARSKRVWLTERGMQLIAMSVQSVSALQSQLLALIGEPAFAAWAAVLKVIYETVTEPPESIAASLVGERSSAPTCRPHKPLPGHFITMDELLLSIARQLGPAPEPLSEHLRGVIGNELASDLERVLEALSIHLDAS